MSFCGHLQQHIHSYLKQFLLIQILLSKMRFAILSTLALVGAAVASTEMQNVKREQACVGDLLCCGELKTPLDPAVDPILLELDINATAIVGSVGLDCTKYLLHTCGTKANEYLRLGLR